MPKFVVDLWLDGYETEEEMEAACKEYIYEQLNFSGSSVKVDIVDPTRTMLYSSKRLIPPALRACGLCTDDKPCNFENCSEDK